MATAEFYCSFARAKFTRRCCVTRKTANDFDPEVLKLFDLYVHGLTSRRGFLDGVAKFTAGGAAAAGLLEALNPRFAEAEQIAKDDPRITASYVEYQSPDGYGTLRAYLAKPAHVEGKLPAVLVVHENRGLNPHIEDISRRLAVDHFIAFAPDALSPLGGYPGDEDKARDLFPKLDQAKTRNDFIAAYNVVMSLPESNGKVGVVGFCYGGGIEFPGDQASRSRRCRTLLRGPADSGGNRENQGGSPHPLCRRRRSHQCWMAGLRGSPQGQWHQLPGLYLSRCSAWVQQRYHAPL